MQPVINTSKILVLALCMVTMITGGCERVRSQDPGSTEHILAFPAISRPENQFQNPYPAPGDDLAQYYGIPPQAVLYVGDQEQTAALGSYCWTQEGSEASVVEACQDSPGIPSPQIFLPGEVQFKGRLRLPLSLSPASVAVYVMPVTPADVMQPPSGDTILWRHMDGQTINLAKEVEQELQLELNPGLNVLYVDARWEGLGSVGFGFLVEAVEP